MPGGRPSKYSQELIDSFCKRVAEGRSVRDVCTDDDMPSRETIYNWLKDERKVSFLDQYARATEQRADAIFDEMLDIADNGENDWMEKRHGDDEESTWVLNGEHVQRSKLRIDARKWALSKMQPKKYGDKIDHNHSGGLNLTLPSDPRKL